MIWFINQEISKTKKHFIKIKIGFIYVNLYFNQSDQTGNNFDYQVMKYTQYIIIIILLNACARVGRPTGGDKDVTPPKLLKSTPANETLNFHGQEMILEFDEFITLKDPAKNILISPPLENQPVITPLGIGTKRLKIKFQDSLNPNTTYQINFGESIADYNEANKLNNLQLVFSTGPVIDSLSLQGKIKAIHYDKKPDKILVGLYQAYNFTDSIVYKQKPYYVTLSETDGHFKFNHLKAGNYRIIALADENRDYKYQQGKESIGFTDKIISIPQDSLVKLNLFKEYPVLSIEDIAQKSRQHIIVKFKGNPDSLKVSVITSVKKQQDFFDKNQWHLWYQTAADSIELMIPLPHQRKKKYKRKRNDQKDSLQVIITGKRRINPTDSLVISANMPIKKIDTAKVSLLSDSTSVAYRLRQLTKGYFEISFDKLLGKSYNLRILPETVTGFTGQTNRDTLKANISIPKAEIYGKLILHLNNTTKKPLFVELLKNNNIDRKTPTQTGNDFIFPYLTPGKYRLRIIVDANNNNRWDTGSYLRHLQPEQSFESGKVIEIRANWDVNQSLMLDELK